MKNQVFIEHIRRGFGKIKSKPGEYGLIYTASASSITRSVSVKVFTNHAGAASEDTIMLKVVKHDQTVRQAIKQKTGKDVPYPTCDIRCQPNNSLRIGFRATHSRDKSFLVGDAYLNLNPLDQVYLMTEIKEFDVEIKAFSPPEQKQPRLKLYHLSVDREDFDPDYYPHNHHYYAAVVAAPNEEIARCIYPRDGTIITDWDEEIVEYWADKPEHVTVRYIGEAAGGIEQGVIQASSRGE